MFNQFGFSNDTAVICHFPLIQEYQDKIIEGLGNSDNYETIILSFKDAFGCDFYGYMPNRELELKGGVEARKESDSIFLGRLFEQLKRQKKLKTLTLEVFYFNPENYAELLRIIETSENLTDIDFKGCSFTAEQNLEIATKAAFKYYQRLHLSCYDMPEDFSKKLEKIFASNYSLVSSNVLRKIACRNAELFIDLAHRYPLTDEEKNILKRNKDSAQRAIKSKICELELDLTILNKFE